MWRMSSGVNVENERAEWMWMRIFICVWQKNNFYVFLFCIDIYNVET